MPSRFSTDENVVLFGDVAMIFSMIIGRLFVGGECGGAECDCVAIPGVMDTGHRVQLLFSSLILVSENY